MVGMMRSMLTMPKPVIVVANGHVRAGGFGLVGAADMAFVGPEATFALTEARLGLAPSIISVVLVPKMTPALGRTLLPHRREFRPGHGRADRVGDAGGFERRGVDRSRRRSSRRGPESLPAGAGGVQGADHRGHSRRVRGTRGRRAAESAALFASDDARGHDRVPHEAAAQLGFESVTAARQPQQERSRATRERLLDECIDMLATQAGRRRRSPPLPKPPVCRAGPHSTISPTRESLITAVMEQMFETMTADASVVLADVPDDLDTRVNAVVDKAVAIYTGTQFKAALQVWAAAASDPALQEVILPLEAAASPGGAQVHRRRLDPAGAPGCAPPGAGDTRPRARVCLADTLSDDSRRREQVVATWCGQLVDALSQ